jgi:hypothetical protein
MPLALAGRLIAVQICYPADLPLILTKNPSFRSGTRYKSGGLTPGFVFDICIVILADYHQFSCFAIIVKAVHNSIFSFHLLS